MEKFYTPAAHKPVVWLIPLICIIILAFLIKKYCCKPRMPFNGFGMAVLQKADALGQSLEMPPPQSPYQDKKIKVLKIGSDSIRAAEEGLAIPKIGL